MSALALELDAALASLPPQDAKALESDVRDALRKAREAEREAIRRMVRERRPELLEFVGLLEDIPFEAPSDPAPPPLEEW